MWVTQGVQGWFKYTQTSRCDMLNQDNKGQKHNDYLNRHMKNIEQTYYPFIIKIPNRNIFSFIII